MARNSEKRENEKYRLQVLEYGKKIEKMWKFRTTFQDMKYGKKRKKKTLNNMENEKCTLQDLDYGKKTENHGK